MKQPYVEIEVRTTLDQSATDESFAIDNVMLWKRQAYVADVIRTYSRYMMFECSEDRECNGKFGDWSNDCDNSNSKDKEKRDKMESNASNLHSGASEVFLMANNQNDADTIYAMNDMEANSIIKARQDKVKQKGSVDMTELPDIQRDINEQMMSSRRN